MMIDEGFLKYCVPPHHPFYVAMFDEISFPLWDTTMDWKPQPWRRGEVKSSTAWGGEALTAGTPSIGDVSVYPPVI